MKTIEIDNLNGKVFNSIESAKNALNFITDKTGIKESFFDGFSERIRLQKEVLTNGGLSLYSISINLTYENEDFYTRKYKLNFNYSESLSMMYKCYIDNAIKDNELILTDEMQTKLTQVNN